MINPVTCKITGLEELVKELSETQPKKAKGAMRAGLKAGAVPMLAAMRQEAPRESGFLDEHFNTKISVKKGGTDGTAYVGPEGQMYYPNDGREMFTAGGRRLVRTGKFGTKGAQIPVVSVARFNEFGVQSHGMAANPFMSRAYYGTWTKSLALIAETIKEKLGL